MLRYLFARGNLHLALLTLRLWTGAMMLYHGGLKLFGGMDRFLETVTVKLGLPAPLGWAAALTEFVGGALLVFGFLVRPAALATAVVMAVAAFGAHASDPWSRKEFALCYFVLSIAIAIAGAGDYSLDARLRQKATYRYQTTDAP
ncbi:MAG: DoxX family protein [Chlorobi bacterium]|nr:DoxX family protein [Chlorobiota bacterium]